MSRKRDGSTRVTDRRNDGGRKRAGWVIIMEKFLINCLSVLGGIIK